MLYEVITQVKEIPGRSVLRDILALEIEEIGHGSARDPRLQEGMHFIPNYRLYLDGNARRLLGEVLQQYVLERIGFGGIPTEKREFDRFFSYNFV